LIWIGNKLTEVSVLSSWYAAWPIKSPGKPSACVKYARTNHHNRPEMGRKETSMGTEIW
jgi:hypothetical protein